MAIENYIYHSNINNESKYMAGYLTNRYYRCADFQKNEIFCVDLMWNDPLADHGPCMLHAL